MFVIVSLGLGSLVGKKANGELCKEISKQSKLSRGLILSLSS